MVWLTVSESTQKFKVKLRRPLFLNMLPSVVIRDQNFDTKTRQSNIFKTTHRTDLINSISERKSKDLIVGEV